jgi:hypothetical protein
VLRVLGTEVGSGPDGKWAFTGARSGHRNTVTQPRKRNADPLPVDATPADTRAVISR